MHFSSGADYATLGSPADLNFGTDTDFSFSFWTRLVAWSGDPAFISNKNWGSGGNPGYVLATDDDGHFQWNLAGAPGGRKDYDGPGGTFGSSSAGDGVWHHVAVTFNRDGNATTYIDGVLRNGTALTANENDLDTPVGLNTNIGQDGTGAYPDGHFGDADIDDVGVWRRLLTPQEVASIYGQGLQGLDLSTATGVPPALPPTITGQRGPGGTNVTLTIGGGTGPYTVQKKTNLSDAEWVDLFTTNATTVILPITGVSGYFRVADRVTFNVTLNGANERPTPINPAGTASGTVVLDGNSVSVNVTYTGMTSAVNNAHIHGPASTEASAGVLVPLSHTGGTSGTVTGTATLSALNVQRMLDGLTYVNIHTVNNTAGEIRGQIIRTP
jgi:hypothetical protein